MFLCCVATLLKRNSLVYDDIQLWEIHEAFAAQVLSHIKAMESPEFLRDKAGVTGSFGAFPRDRMNPNGGSVALGHPFGATGARILSQAVKQLPGMPSDQRAIVSIAPMAGRVRLRCCSRNDASAI
jgi:acetyl-CoA C-acetyltransferase